MEGMEQALLCDVIVVLNIAAFLHRWVLRGEGFGSKYKPYFTWEMTKEFARCSAGIIRLYFVAFCPIVGMQRSIVKLKIVGTASFLRTSWQRLKEGSNKLVTTRFCLRLSSVKCFTQTRECFEDILFSAFFEPFSFKKSFGSWGNWKC